MLFDYEPNNEWHRLEEVLVKSGWPELKCLSITVTFQDQSTIAAFERGLSRTRHTQSLRLRRSKQLDFQFSIQNSTASDDESDWWHTIWMPINFLEILFHMNIVGDETHFTFYWLMEWHTICTYDLNMTGIVSMESQTSSWLSDCHSGGGMDPNRMNFSSLVFFLMDLTSFERFFILFLGRILQIFKWRIGWRYWDALYRPQCPLECIIFQRWQLLLISFIINHPLSGTGTSNPKVISLIYTMYILEWLILIPKNVLTSG